MPTQLSPIPSIHQPTGDSVAGNSLTGGSIINRTERVQTRSQFIPPQLQQSEAPQKMPQVSEEPELLQYAKSKLLKDKEENFKKIVFHKVKIIKKDGKIIKKPYKIVYKKAIKNQDPKAVSKRTESSAKVPFGYNRMESAPVRMTKQKLVRCETNPLNQPFNSNTPLIDIGKTREKRERASHTPTRENHIHYHHYYIFNQGPQIYNFLPNTHAEPPVDLRSEQVRLNSRNQPAQFSSRNPQGRGVRLRGNVSDSGQPPNNDSFLSVDSEVYGKGNISFELLDQENEGNENATSFNNLIKQNSKAEQYYNLTGQSGIIKRSTRVKSVIPNQQFTKEPATSKMQVNTTGKVAAKRPSRFASANKRKPRTPQKHGKQSGFNSLKAVRDQDRGDTEEERKEKSPADDDICSLFKRGTSNTAKLDDSKLPIKFVKPDTPTVQLFVVEKVPNHHLCFLLRTNSGLHRKRASQDHGENIDERIARYRYYRLWKVRRFLEKRAKRNWNQKEDKDSNVFQDQVRSAVARKRPRFQGKFLSKELAEQFEQAEKTNTVTLKEFEVKNPRKPKILEEAQRKGKDDTKVQGSKQSSKKQSASKSTAGKHSAEQSLSEKAGLKAKRVLKKQRKEKKEKVKKEKSAAPADKPVRKVGRPRKIFLEPEADADDLFL